MKRILNNGFNKPKLCYCKADNDDPVVKNGLAITPSRMHELVQNGIPISEQTAQFSADFIEGYSDKNLDFEPPHIYTRHADMISAFNTQIEERDKMQKYVQQIDFAKEVQNG